MKKLLTITAIIILAIICSGSYLYQDEGKWVESECEICGKTVFQWVKYNYDSGGMLYFGTTPFCWGEQATKLLWIGQPTWVCGECQKKYGQEYQKLMSSTFDKWLENKKGENKTIRKQHEKERRKNEIEKLEKEIREAQTKIQYYKDLN